MTLQPTVVILSPLSHLPLSYFKEPWSTLSSISVKPTTWCASKRGVNEWLSLIALQTLSIVRCGIPKIKDWGEGRTISNSQLDPTSCLKACLFLSSTLKSRYSSGPPTWDPENPGRTSTILLVARDAGGYIQEYISASQICNQSKLLHQVPSSFLQQLLHATLPMVTHLCGLCNKSATSGWDDSHSISDYH